MSRFHRFLLTCLLALAIALQGFATAAMAHGVAAPAIEAAIDMQMHDCADMKAAATHKDPCSACAACCGVAAPGFSFLPSVAPASAAIVAVPVLRPRVAFVTGGPERPPRDHLA